MFFPPIAEACGECESAKGIPLRTVATGIIMPIILYGGFKFPLLRIDDRYGNTQYISKVSYPGNPGYRLSAFPFTYSLVRNAQLAGKLSLRKVSAPAQ